MSLHDGIELEHNCGSVFMQFSLFTNGLDFFNNALTFYGGSVAVWLACWTQAQWGLGSNRSRDAVG